MLPWRQDIGLCRPTDVRTYTFTQSHSVRESAKKVEKEDRGGVLGSLTFQVEFLLQCGNVKLFSQTHLSKSGRVS